eukprot:CAMPEP_0116968994 /NCGR_PEP_ID=MMETSP0467-20121206/51620_1 /TAXON_ID=283647 /ORGANISM="Mesodinium pulex, Strain SPMC105" /LENGTH=88 /DNA_ID=CAMNT_0004659485 /DNA_START=420 /DNA_END=683 /DNA_ORIENTATION=+
MMLVLGSNFNQLYTLIHINFSADLKTRVYILANVSASIGGMVAPFLSLKIQVHFVLFISGLLCIIIIYNFVEQDPYVKRSYENENEND